MHPLWRVHRPSIHSRSGAGRARNTSGSKANAKTNPLICASHPCDPALFCCGSGACGFVIVGGGDELYPHLRGHLRRKGVPDPIRAQDHRGACTSLRHVQRRRVWRSGDAAAHVGVADSASESHATRPKPQGPARPAEVVCGVGEFAAERQDASALGRAALKAVILVEFLGLGRRGEDEWETHPLSYFSRPSPTSPPVAPAPSSPFNSTPPQPSPITHLRPLEDDPHIRVSKVDCGQLRACGVEGDHRDRRARSGGGFEAQQLHMNPRAR
eukprot:scaffold4012_cov109-Isochrysis_galbana.AAC.4